MHKAISLSAEMAEIRNAVERARFLADELATGGMEDRKRELQAPLTISAILVLVELRLHQVERVLRGEEDPLLLWAPHNDVSPIQAEDEEHDLVLRSWSEPGEDEEPSPRKKASKSPCRARPGGLVRHQRPHLINRSEMPPLQMVPKILSPPLTPGIHEGRALKNGPATRKPLSPWGWGPCQDPIALPKGEEDSEAKQSRQNEPAIHLS
jgi:hypothetical protein